MSWAPILLFVIDKKCGGARLGELAQGVKAEQTRQQTEADQQEDLRAAHVLKVGHVGQQRELLVSSNSDFEPQIAALHLVREPGLQALGSWCLLHGRVG